MTTTRELESGSSTQRRIVRGMLDDPAYDLDYLARSRYVHKLLADADFLACLMEGLGKLKRLSHKPGPMGGWDLAPAEDGTFVLWADIEDLLNPGTHEETTDAKEG